MIFIKIVAIALLILLSSFNTSDQSGKAGGNNFKMKIEFYLPLGGMLLVQLRLQRLKLLQTMEFRIGLILKNIIPLTFEFLNREYLNFQ